MEWLWSWGSKNNTNHDASDGANNESGVSSIDDKQPNDVSTNPTACDDDKSEHVNKSKQYKVKVDKNGGIYANIRGLYPKSNQTKVPYLEDLANVSNAPFICLTETHLHPEILDAEIQIKNYTLFRSDRQGRTHGGVCTYVRRDLATSVILKDSNSYCDTLILRIHQLNLLLITFYRPPKCPSILFMQSLQTIKQMILNFEEHDKRAHDILFTSDCNFPEIKWVNGVGYLSEHKRSGHVSEDKQQMSALLEFAEEIFCTK